MNGRLRSGVVTLPAVTALAVALLAMPVSAVSRERTPSALDSGPRTEISLSDIGAHPVSSGGNLDDLIAMVKAVEGGRGFAAMAVHEIGIGIGILEVVWKAPAPTAIRALNGELVNGYLIRVSESVLSQVDLIALSDRLLGGARNGSLPTISFVTGNEDQSGLVVAVPRLGNDGLELSTMFSAVAGVPTAVVSGEGPLPTSRRDNGHRWRGGSLFRIRTFPKPYAFCSTGFPVRMNGQGRVLTARHCSARNNLWDDGGGEPMTDAPSDTETRSVDDTMIIDPNGDTQGLVYGGSPSATRDSGKHVFRVASAYSPPRNGEVCTSGANSGMHCGLEVLDSTMLTWNCGSHSCHGWRARRDARSSRPHPSIVGGDSGGPVFRIRDDSRIAAQGIIYGGSGSVPCGDLRLPVKNCYATVWFTDIERVLESWNATIQTTDAASCRTAVRDQALRAGNAAC